jgi:hypothetical protein
MVERRSTRTLRGPIPQLKSMTTYKEHMGVLFERY